MDQKHSRLYVWRYAHSSFLHLGKKVFRIFKTLLIPGKGTAFDSFLCINSAVSGGKLESVYRNSLFFGGVYKFCNGVVTVCLQLWIIHGRAQISQGRFWQHCRFSCEVCIPFDHLAYRWSADQEQVDIPSVCPVTTVHFPVIALFPSHIKVAFIGVVIKITYRFFGISVQFDVKRDVFIQGICFFGIISHSVFGTHSHKFLGFVKFSALLSKAVETIFRTDLTGMDPAVIAVFHISQIYDICVNLCTVLVVNADTERIFFYNHFQLFSLDHSLILAVRQRGLGRCDTLSVIFHKSIHTVFPGGGHKTVGFLCKIAVKSGTDTQDLIGKEPDTDRHAVCLYSKVGILLCYGGSL